MPEIDVKLSCPVQRSFRVEQAAGMFDLKLEKISRVEFSAEVPAIEDAWQIGLITGPSGSGKTQLARRAFAESLVERFDWPADRAVVDAFGDTLPIKQIVQAFSSVGFSSPPAWLRPYAVLSNGERFRCDLAAALLSDRELIVFDEFSSVVDRTVAKIGSAALHKAIHRDKRRRFVAITCHYDVAEWLQPDWILDMAGRTLARRFLQRPELLIEIAPVHHSAWELFRRHHYLSGFLLRNARCFAAFWGEQPVAFSAWIHAMTKGRRSGDMREHRTVVLPDFQGVGIGNRLSEFLASLWTGLGDRAFSTTSHPAMIRHRSVSSLWRRNRLGIVSPTGGTGLFATTVRREKYLGSCQRITAGFQYVGPSLPRDQARALLSIEPAVFCWDYGAGKVLAHVQGHPGATVGVLARHTGLSSTRVRACLEELLAAKAVRREGRGGSGANRFAFYPAG